MHLLGGQLCWRFSDLSNYTPTRIRIQIVWEEGKHADHHHHHDSPQDNVVHRQASVAPLGDLPLDYGVQAPFSGSDVDAPFWPLLAGSRVSEQHQNTKNLNIFAIRNHFCKELDKRTLV